MNVGADGVVVERPVVALVVAAVATVVYVGIQVVLDGAVAPLETAVFVVVFTAVYVFGNRYLRERVDSDGTDSDGGDSASTDTGPESE